MPFDGQGWRAHGGRRGGVRRQGSATGMCPGGRVAGLSRLGYTPGMKTAISIPDDVFADAERLARALKKSRSQLYSRALKEYVARHAADQVTEALDRVCGDGPPADNDFAKAAARRTLRRSQW